MLPTVSVVCSRAEEGIYVAVSFSVKNNFFCIHLEILLGEGVGMRKEGEGEK